MARTKGKGSEDLYKLIHLLSPQEKGYFKKYAKRFSTESSNYLKLFDAISAQKEFEEESLARSFKGYARMKVYLFDTIIDALVQNLSPGKSDTVDMLKLYSRAMLLEKKGFVTQAAKMYRSGLKMVEGTTQQLFGFYFNKELLRIMGSNSSINSYYKTRNKLEDEMLVQLDRERFMLQLDREKAKLKAFIAKEEFGIKHEVAKESIDFDLLLNRDIDVPYTVRSNCDEALITYYCMSGNYDQALPLAELNLASIEKRHKKQPIPNTYSRAIVHYCMPCAHMHLHQQAHKKLDDMISMKVDSVTIAANIEMRYVNYKLMQYAYAHDITKGTAFIKQAEKLYPNAFNGIKPSHYYTQIVAHAAYLHFYSSNHKAYLDFVNSVNMPYVQKHVPVTYRDMEIARIMLQIEFGNYELLPTILRSVTTKLKKVGLIDPFIKMLLQFFKDIIKQGKNIDKEAYLHSMQKEVKQGGVHSFMGMKPYTDYVSELKLN